MGHPLRPRLVRSPIGFSISTRSARPSSGSSAPSTTPRSAARGCRPFRSGQLLAIIPKRSADEVNAAVGLIRRLLEAGEDHANLVRVRLGTKGKEDEAIADPTMA